MTAGRSRFSQWADATSGKTDKTISPAPKPVAEASKPKEIKEIRASSNGTIPKWIRVVYQPRVTVRKAPSLNAPSVAFLEAGEIVEIAEMKQGWVRLADAEKQARDVSEDCIARWQSCKLGHIVGGVRTSLVSGCVRATCPCSHEGICPGGTLCGAEEVWQGWVRLSAQDRQLLDISEDCGSWVLIDGYAKGAGRLLVACPPPPERRPHLEVAE
eukprot:symbB.v1.2.004846.t1/scaffold279.1/size242841/31